MSKLFSNLIKNENIKTTSLIVSRNVFSKNSLKPIASKSQDWKDVPKKLPTLSLKVNSPSKKLSLEVNDKKFCHICNAPTCKLLTTKDENEEQVTKYDSNTITIVVDREELCRTICGSSDGPNDGSNKLSTNQNVANVDKESEYCFWCKAPKCKLAENVSKEQSSDNVDKESQHHDLYKAPKSELAENSPEKHPNKRKNVSNDTNKSKLHSKEYSSIKARTSYTNIAENSSGKSLRDTNSSEASKENEQSSENVDNGSEYCALCDAPKCKLEENGSKEESNDDVDKGSQYCDLCKAPKCELLAKLSDDISEPKSQSPNEKVDKESEYCDVCKSPKCKLIENSPENSPGNSENKGNNASNDTSANANKMQEKDNSSTKASLKPKNNVDTNNPDYCSSCNLPKCKYESSEPFKTGARKAKSSNRMSNNSHNIRITVNQSEFRSMVSKNTEKKTKSTPNMNEIQMDGDNRKNKSGKGTNFSSSYEIDNIFFD